MLSEIPGATSKSNHHHILEKGGPITEFDRIAKAAAVGYRVEQRNVEGQQGKESHHGQSSCCCPPHIQLKKQQKAQAEFTNSQGYAQGKRQGMKKTPSKGGEIVFKLNHAPKGIDGLYKT